MVTQKEFMQILENHLSIREDGSVFIKDPKLAEKYSTFLKQNAKNERDMNVQNGLCINIWNC